MTERVNARGGVPDTLGKESLDRGPPGFRRNLDTRHLVPLIGSDLPTHPGVRESERVG